LKKRIALESINQGTIVAFCIADFFICPQRCLIMDSNIIIENNQIHELNALLLGAKVSLSLAKYNIVNN
jgi:hypothetical protein